MRGIKGEGGVNFVGVRVFIVVCILFRTKNGQKNGRPHAYKTLRFARVKETSIVHNKKGK